MSRAGPSSTRCWRACVPRCRRSPPTNRARASRPRWRCCTSSAANRRERCSCLTRLRNPMEPSADLLIAERQLLTAARTADADALDALLDDRMIFIEPDGSPQTKAEHIALFTSNDLVLDVVEREAMDAVVVGTTGVTRVTLTIAGTASGEPFSLHMVT